MMDLSDRKDLIRAALGKIPLDLRIDHVQVVNVYNGTIEWGSIGIKGGRIVTPYADGTDSDRVVDGQGRYALPGFIDTHVHLDSTLVVPENLSQLLLPHGTTVMLADPMEIANVAGLKGFQALLQSIEKLDYHIFLEVSSRVPTAPGLETTGGELDLEAVKEILTWPQAVSLGELDPSKVLEIRDEYLLKVQAAQDLGKICNGHAVGRIGKELVAYACGGLADDHECVDYQEALSRLRLGLAVLIREGSTERNLDPILEGVVREGTYSPHLMFCTDDKHPDEILSEGHIDYMVNRAIELGLRPMQAIQMATINAAQHFRIDHLVGSLSPARWADIILTEELEVIRPLQVFFKGKQVVDKGLYTGKLPPPAYPDWLFHTVTVTKGRLEEDFRLLHDQESARVWVIDLVPGQIINTKIQAELSVVSGQVKPDPERDILKLAVVERHGKNGNIGISFVRGFGIKHGALGSSIAHDHHNIIAAGTSDKDIALCVAEIERMQGGFVIVSEGEMLGSLPLPIGGLLSDEPVERIIRDLERINKAYHDLGGSLSAPFMTLSFISLPTVPDLGMTDRGLVDVFEHKLIEPFVA